MRIRTSSWWIAGVATLILVASGGLRAGVQLQAQPSSATPEAKPGAKSIARIWRGRTLSSKADEYEVYLRDSGISKIRATAGNLGAYVLRRSEGDKTEFLVMSLWQSIDAIKRFAGEHYEKAVILPRDREYLLEVEPKVVHYQVVQSLESGVAAPRNSH
jgi:heme-degrading monooxygenase HmoA